MDLGLAPRPLGFGATSAWGRRRVGVGFARLGRGPTRPWTPSANHDILPRQRARLGGAMNEAIARPGSGRAQSPPQSGRAARARLVRERRRQRERGRAPRRDADDPPLGQEGIPGRLAREGDDLHRPYDARRRRHARARAPALRQGAPSAERGASRRARARGRQSDGRGGLRLSDHGRPGGQGARGLGDSRSPPSPPAFPPGSRRSSCGSTRSAMRSARARARSTSSSPALMCSAATGARSMTRSRRCARPAGRRI